MGTTVKALKSTSNVESVFVVIDPMHLVQPGLAKAEWVAARNSAKLHLYCCIWEAGLESDRVRVEQAIAATRAWLQRIAAASELAIDVSIEVDWHADWRRRIVEAARASGADLIVKSMSQHGPVRRQLMQTSDWMLLRDASCPTLLVHPNRAANPKTVLAAVKLKPGSKTYTSLNGKVLSLGRRLAAAFAADLHAVTVYKDEDIYFDRQQFADSCELPRNRIHATDGPPVRGIAATAAKIGADVVIIGCAGEESSQRGIVIGDTAQRVIDEVDTDVIVIPAD